MSDSPIFLTKNSHGTSVIMSIEQYSSLTDTFKRKLNEADRFTENTAFKV
jgi:toxin-antitoxin system, antitoxin component, PHD family